MRIHVRRRPGEQPSTYELPDQMDGKSWAGVSLVAAFAYIQQRLDPTFTYAVSCARGTCNICVVRTGGAVVTACTTAVVDGMLVEPTKAKLQVRDVLVETSLIRHARVDSNAISENFSNPSRRPEKPGDTQ